MSRQPVPPTAPPALRGRARAKWATTVLLPLILSALAAVEAARVTGFGADAAVSFAQAARSLAEREYPALGLINSHEFWNPNGLILLILPLVALARDPVAFCVLLSVVQAGIVLVCFRWLATGGSTRFNGVVYSFWLPSLLWTPVLGHTSVDVWAQYVGRTVLCLLFALALSTAWEASVLRDAALGFTAVFAPAVHLGLLPAAPIALLSLLIPSRRARVRLLPLAGGAMTAVVVSWLPWVVAGGASSAAEVRLAGSLISHNQWAAAVLGPIIDLPSLLSDPYEGWLHAARAKLLTLETDRVLQTFTDVRCVLGIVVLLASAFLLLARRRTGVIALETLGYVLLLLYVWEAKGGSREQRPDLGGMALQPLYLGIVTAGYRLLACVDERLGQGGHAKSVLAMRTALIVGVVIQMFLGWRGFERIARDVRGQRAFTLADIPLEEKVQAMTALDAEAGGRAQVAVGYHNPAFHSVFPYVARYGEREWPPRRDYRQGSFFEAVLNRRAKARYTFVDTVDRPEYVLTYPAQSPWASAAGYVVLWQGPRLGLWRRR